MGGDRLADLHLHTAYSDDSQLTVERAFELALEKGLDAIAITDHDGVDAIAEALAAGIDAIEIQRLSLLHRPRSGST